MKVEFLMSEMQNDGSSITLVPVKPLRSKKEIQLLYTFFNSRESIKIDFPDPVPVEMTLEQVCKELGKDIKIVG